MTSPVVWLASYPRSGNTFLRTIIYSCFGVRSASLYPRDFGNTGIGDMVGHIEHGPNGTITFGDEPVWLLKTHQLPQDDRPAIYVIRDGGAATTSLYEFYKGTMPLRTIVEGQNRFGTWAGHVLGWQPRKRPLTLLLRYEDLVADLHGTVDRLAEFLRLTPRSYSVPPRDALASADGQWVRAQNARRIALDGDDLARFWQINGTAMQSYGYARLGAADPVRRLRR